MAAITEHDVADVIRGEPAPVAASWIVTTMTERGFAGVDARAVNQILYRGPFDKVTTEGSARPRWKIRGDAVVFTVEGWGLFALPRAAVDAADFLESMFSAAAFVGRTIRCDAAAEPQRRIAAAARAAGLTVIDGAAPVIGNSN